MRGRLPAVALASSLTLAGSAGAGVGAGATGAGGGSWQSCSAASCALTRAACSPSVPLSRSIGWLHALRSCMNTLRSDERGFWMCSTEQSIRARYTRICEGVRDTLSSVSLFVGSG